MGFNIQSGYPQAAHGRHHHHHHRAERQQAGTPAPATAEATAPSASNGVTLGTPQSAEATATNILKHVYQNVESMRANGASQEQIDSRLAAAREGIAAGYADARETLEGMGLLNDELGAEIDRGESLVNEGLDQIAAGAIPDILVAPEAPEEEETADVPQPVFSASAQRTKNRMSLEVMTQDGDRIKVDFSQRQGSLQFSAGGFSVNASSFSEKWDMSVDGHLDDGEMAALTQLFDDVQSLSEKFFAGDLGAALEEAMSLGFDGNELASMSLDLRQRSFSSVSRAYGAAQPELPTPALSEKKSYLADYADSYIKALDKANPLAEPRQTLKDMLAQLDPDKSPVSVLKQFTDGLNRLL